MRIQFAKDETECWAWLGMAQESEAEGLRVQGQPWLNQTSCQRDGKRREVTEPQIAVLRKFNNK